MDSDRIDSILTPEQLADVDISIQKEMALNNKRQQFLLHKLMNYFKGFDTKIPKAFAKEISDSGLCDLYDIEQAYTDDDFIRDLVSIRIGWAHQFFEITKEVCLETGYLDSFVEDAKKHTERECSERLNLPVVCYFYHFCYNSYLERLECIFFVKCK